MRPEGRREVMVAGEVMEVQGNLRCHPYFPVPAETCPIGITSYSVPTTLHSIVAKSKVRCNNNPFISCART